MKKKPRHKPDRQKFALYAAERETDAWMRKRDYFPSAADAMRWVYKVCLSKWTVNRFGRSTAPQTFWGDDDGDASGSASQLVLPTWCHFKLALLHEIAHSINGWLYGWPNIQGHGPEYATIYLELVKHFLSRRDAKQLLKAYEKHGVKCLSVIARTAAGTTTSATARVERRAATAASA